jgi:hypothetical protein
MKTAKFIFILVLILTFSCQKEKKTTETTPDSKTELKPQDSNVESGFDTNLTSKVNSENLTYRKITELIKYKGFTKIVGMVLDGTDKALAYIQKDSLQVLVLEQIIRDNSNQVKYEILDEVLIITDKTKLFSEPAHCELIDNPEEKFIFGIINNQEKEYFDNDHILKVWKVDLTDNKFREINKEKVKCFNHWFEYDG